LQINEALIGRSVLTAIQLQGPRCFEMTQPEHFTKQEMESKLEGIKNYIFIFENRTGRQSARNVGSSVL
jgi:hypothetical protein